MEIPHWEASFKSQRVSVWRCSPSQVPVMLMQTGRPLWAARGPGMASTLYWSITSVKLVVITSYSVWNHGWDYWCINTRLDCVTLTGNAPLAVLQRNCISQCHAVIGHHMHDLTWATSVYTLQRFPSYLLLLTCFYQSVIHVNILAFIGQIIVERQSGNKGKERRETGVSGGKEVL